MNKVLAYFDEVAHLLLGRQPDWNEIEKLDDEEKFREGVEIAKMRMHTYYVMNGKTPAENYALLYRVRSGRAQKTLLERLISESEKSRSAYNSLKYIVIDLLRETVPLPAELSIWLADVVDDRQKKEKRRSRPKKQGKNKEDNAIRNSAIRVVANELISHGWNASRYMDAKYFMCCIEGGSAADVAGVAHNELCGDNLKYKTIEGIILGRQYTPSSGWLTCTSQTTELNCL